jgi:hypothetical protein
LGARAVEFLLAEAEAAFFLCFVFVALVEPGFAA